MNFHEEENYLHYLTTNVYVVLGFVESINALGMADEAFDSELVALNVSLLQAAADITDLDKRLSQLEINGIEYDKQDNF